MAFELLGFHMKVQIINLWTDTRRCSQELLWGGELKGGKKVDQELPRLFYDLLYFKNMLQ